MDFFAAILRYARIIPTPHCCWVANFCVLSPFYRTRKNSKTPHFWPLISDMNPKKLSQTVSFRRTFAINPGAIQSLMRWKTILKSSFVACAPKHLILFRKDDQRIARTFQFLSKSESNLAETLLRVSDESRIRPGLEAVNGLTGRETENPTISKSLRGFACSPPPRREQTWLATSPISSLKTLRPSLSGRQGVNRRSALTNRKNAARER